MEHPWAETEMAGFNVGILATSCRLLKLDQLRFTTLTWWAGPGNGLSIGETQMADDQIQLVLGVLPREQRLPPGW